MKTVPERGPMIDGSNEQGTLGSSQSSDAHGNSPDPEKGKAREDVDDPRRFARTLPRAFDLSKSLCVETASLTQEPVRSVDTLTTRRRR